MPAANLATHAVCTTLSSSGAITTLVEKSSLGAHRVYNLEIEDYHSFLVGHTGIVVHDRTDPHESVNVQHTQKR